MVLGTAFYSVHQLWLVKHTATVLSFYYKNITLNLTVSKYTYRALSYYHIYYLNKVTRTVSKHTAKVLSCYHITNTIKM